MKLKKCGKCGTEKSVNEFYMNKDIRSSHCKECAKSASKTYWQGHKRRSADIPYGKVNALEEYLRTMRELE